MVLYNSATVLLLLVLSSATPPPCWSAVVVVGIDVVGAYVAAGSSVVDVAVGGVLVVGRGLLVGDGLEPPSWPYSTFAIVAESDDDRTRRRSTVAEL